MKKITVLKKNLYLIILICTIIYYLLNNSTNYLVLFLFEKYFGVEYIYLAAPLTYTLFILILVVIYRRIEKCAFSNLKKIKYSTILNIITISLLFRFFCDPILRLLHIIGVENLPVVREKEPIIKYQLVFFYNYVILVPIIEEILFRGIFLKKLLKTDRNVLPILYSSFLFSLIHIDLFHFRNSLLKILYTFVFGLILGYVFFKYGKRIIYPIVLHAIINLIAFLFNLYPALYWETIEYLGFDYRYWLIVAFFSIMLILVLFRLKNRNQTPLC